MVNNNKEIQGIVTVVLINIHLTPGPDKYDTSHAMREPAFCICKNKDADLLSLFPLHKYM